jgi:hypothetical protein
MKYQQEKTAAALAKKSCTTKKRPGFPRAAEEISQNANEPRT